MTSTCNWNYVQGSLTPADVGTREGGVRNSDSFALWLKGPTFLLQESLEPKLVRSTLLVRSASIDVDLLSLKSNTCLDRMIESAPDLYKLKKRVAYLIAFKQYIVGKLQKRNLCKPKLDVDYFDNAFMDVVKFVNRTLLGAAIKLLQEKFSDAYDLILNELGNNSLDLEHVRRVSELKTLRNLSPFVDNDLMLRVEGRLENADLPTDTKHLLLPSSRHLPIRLIVFDKHPRAGHVGPCYTLMRTRQGFGLCTEFRALT